MTESSSPLRLPDRPSLEQLRKQAKELHNSAQFPTLAAAQHALARRYGFQSWPKLKLAVEMAAIRQAIEKNDVSGVRKLLRSSPKLSSAGFADGSTPLHLAAGNNCPEIVSLLVDAGAKLSDTYSGSGHTALSWAVTVEAFEAALKLVELGDEPDLFCASGLGLLPKVQAFWSGDTLLPHPSKTGSSRYSDSGERLPCPPDRDADHVSDALYIACRTNRDAVAGWLLDHGADPNWRGYMGASCLAWAEFTGNPELCALLRGRGGSDDILDSEFRATPRVFGLMVLTAWGFWRDRLYARLKANPALVDSRGEWGTLLNAAAYNGQIESAKVLLEFGANKTIRNAAGLTPAELAAARGHSELATLLD